MFSPHILKFRPHVLGIGPNFEYKDLKNKAVVYQLSLVRRRIGTGAGRLLQKKLNSSCEMM